MDGQPQLEPEEPAGPKPEPPPKPEAKAEAPPRPEPPALRAKPEPPLPPHLLAWVKRLGLSQPLRSIRRDFCSGYLVAEVRPACLQCGTIGLNLRAPQWKGTNYRICFRQPAPAPPPRRS